MPEAKATKKPFRALLIEDDRDQAFLFQRAVAVARDLLDADIVVDPVDNGLAALDLVSEPDLRERLPQVIVLDLEMPLIDGVEFLRAIRQNLQLKNTAVIVLTETTARVVHEEAILAGADRVLVKPTDNSALVRMALEMTG